MKKLSLKIQINKSAEKVFVFCLNPENTPNWVGSIVKEETNEWPAKLGTIYRNTSDGKKWNEYIVSGFEEDKTFTLSSKDGNYHVRYAVTPIDDTSCELEYYEWVDKGELEEPFEMKHLEKLKEIIENQK